MPVSWDLTATPPPAGGATVTYWVWGAKCAAGPFGPARSGNGVLHVKHRVDQRDYWYPVEHVDNHQPVYFPRDPRSVCYKVILSFGNSHFELLEEGRPHYRAGGQLRRTWNGNLEAAGSTVTDRLPTRHDWLPVITNPISSDAAARFPDTSQDSLGYWLALNSFTWNANTRYTWVLLAQEAPPATGRLFRADPAGGEGRGGDSSGAFGGDTYYRDTWLRYNDCSNSTLGDSIRAVQGSGNTRTARALLPKSTRKLNSLMRGAANTAVPTSKQAPIPSNRVLSLASSEVRASMPPKGASGRSTQGSTHFNRAGSPAIQAAAAGPVVKALRQGALPSRGPVQSLGPAKASKGSFVHQSTVPRTLPAPASGIPVGPRHTIANAAKGVQAGRITKPLTSKASRTWESAANARAPALRPMAAAA